MSLSSPLYALHCAGEKRGWWCQHRMGRGLERGVSCLSNLDPGQNASSWCMQGTSTSHTHHLTICFWQVHRVVYVALLGELCIRSDRQALQLHQYDIMRHIALLSDDQQFRWCPLYSFSPFWLPQRGRLIDSVHLICSTQPGVSYTCPKHV